MLLNGKNFIRYDKLGEKIAEKLCLGWDVTTVLFDRMGNGMFIFKHAEHGEVCIDFTEIKVEDIVTIEYNKLGNVIRNYWGEY